MNTTTRIIPVKFCKQKINFKKNNFELDENNEECFTYSKLFFYFKKSLAFHILSSIILGFLMFIKNFCIKNTCWELKEGCNECHIVKKAYLIIFHEPIEYFRPIYYLVYVVFYTNKIQKFQRNSRILQILLIVPALIFSFIWKPDLFFFNDNETPEDFIYPLFFIISFWYFICFVKRETKITWKEYLKDCYLNIVLMILNYVYGMIILNVLPVFQNMLRAISDHWDIYYQLFLLVFLSVIEYAFFILLLKYSQFLNNKWDNNNSPLLFVVKSFLMYSYSLRLGNFAKLNELQWSFCINIISFFFFLVELLTGKSFGKIIKLHKFRKYFASLIIMRSLQQRNPKIKSKVLNYNILKRTLKIIAYQKIDFMMIYVPRMLILCLSKEWAIVQPGINLNKKCTFKLASSSLINTSQIFGVIVFDIVLTILCICIVVKRKKWNKYFLYLSEDLPHAEKILLYMGYQLSFEYWLNYYLEVTQYE